MGPIQAVSTHHGLTKYVLDLSRIAISFTTKRSKNLLAHNISQLPPTADGGVKLFLIHNSQLKVQI